MSKIKKNKGKKKVILKLKLASVSPGRFVEMQFAGPTARVAATTVQEAHFESQEGFISLLLGHFKSS